MKLSSIMGINSRTLDFTYRYNPHEGKNIANSKVQTAKVLVKTGIPHPETYKKFVTVEKVDKFDFSKLPSSFVVKPSRGLGGEGIIVVKKRLDDGRYQTADRRKLSESEIKLHIYDILEGAFSMNNVPDVAIIQEYVGRHKALSKLSFRGTPDIRVIVFNQIPVMAMLRLPTRESGGRANLHQGAIAVGIDIATGITTRAFWHGRYIRYKPSTKITRFGPMRWFKKVRQDDTKRKLHGLRVPNWTTILEMAVKTQVVSGLKFAGVDIIIHPTKGPMVLELNAQPGLQIQMANTTGLKRRLQRVDELDVDSIQQGVKIAKVLFGEKHLYGAKTKEREGDITLKVWEKIKVLGVGRRMQVDGKIDTGAWRTSIDQHLAEELKLISPTNVLWTRRVRTTQGVQERPVIYLRFYLGGKLIKTYASVTNRAHMQVPLIVGRRDLTGFIVKSSEDGRRPQKWNRDKSKEANIHK